VVQNRRFTSSTAWAQQENTLSSGEEAKRSYELIGQHEECIP